MQSSKLTGFVLTVHRQEEGQEQEVYALAKSLEFPWSPQAKVAVIKILGELITAIGNAEEF